MFTGIRQTKGVSDEGSEGGKIGREKGFEEVECNSSNNTEQIIFNLHLGFASCLFTFKGHRSAAQNVNLPVHAVRDVAEKTQDEAKEERKRTGTRKFRKVTN